MSNVERILTSKQGRRPHYLREWMERRHMEPRDIIRETGADKSLVSRWLNDERPTTPGPPSFQ